MFGVKADVEDILRKVLLEDSANVYFTNLSGGQKQKMGLALSLVNDPQLLFLDEPTTGLDPQARRAVWDVIRALKKEGRTVLLTTHYLEEAEELADRVAIMNKGKIITSGTPTEIIQNHSSGERLLVHGTERLAKYLEGNTELPVEFDGQNLISLHIKRKEDVVTAVGGARGVRSGLE